jgi:hypothetical protein
LLQHPVFWSWVFYCERSEPSSVQTSKLFALEGGARARECCWKGAPLHGEWTVQGWNPWPLTDLKQNHTLKCIWDMPAHLEVVAACDHLAPPNSSACYPCTPHQSLQAMAVQYLRLLFLATWSCHRSAGFSPGRPSFNSKGIHVGFVVDIVSIWHFGFPIPWFGLLESDQIEPHCSSNRYLLSRGLWCVVVLGSLSSSVYSTCTLHCLVYQNILCFVSYIMLLSVCFSILMVYS